MQKPRVETQEFILSGALLHRKYTEDVQSSRSPKMEVSFEEVTENTVTAL